MSLIVIYNPVCGHGTAKALFEDDIIPFITGRGREIHGIFSTTHPGHAGEIALEQLRSTSQDLTIVLGSGDGTLHEIVDALKGFSNKDQQLGSRAVSFVLVPCGTANALYSSLFPQTSYDTTKKAYAFHSLLSLISPTTSPTPLTFALTSLHQAAEGNKVVQTSVSVVVASTSLHASILHDSEALRASVPGIERFKLAAQKNITRWYSAQVKLLPKAGSAVELYDPTQAKFIPLEGSATLDGPFAYFLSTVNVDRLEPVFRVTPLRQVSASAIGSSLEVVVIRPLRSPSIEDSSDESRIRFAKISETVLMGAYRDGAHVHMRYDKDGSVIEDGPGVSVVEYYRCGGWEWTPVSVSSCVPAECHLTLR